MTVKRRSNAIFFVIAVLIPFVLLAILELGLWWSEYGKKQPLFIAASFNKAEGYVQPNPKLIERYFASPASAPKVSPDTVYFRKKKSPDTYRIVIQGGSSAAGFPYGRFGSLQGMLQQRFKDAFPDKNIEIINTAMAAVNSYTLIDIQDEILEIDPDLVLVYTGHNEYLGVLGAGSVIAGKGSHAATLLYLKLKSLRVFRLIEEVIVAGSSAATNVLPNASFSDVLNDGETLGNNLNHQNERSVMAKAAKGKNIPLGGEVYQRGVDQFSNNLDILLSKYNSANIPVFIGNLVSIENELPPFSGMNKSEQAPENLAYQKALTLLQNPELALQAKVAFVKAKDLDELRFRAPSEFNEIIANKASEHGAVLVDVVGTFEQTQAIFDKQLFLEHVHPTKQGYFLLAEAFFKAFVDFSGSAESPIFRQTNKRYTAKEKKYLTDNISQEYAQKRIPITQVDDLFADFKVAQLTNGFPFKQVSETKPSQVVLKTTGDKTLDALLMKRIQGTDWLYLQKALLKYYLSTGKSHEAAIVSGIIADAMVMSAEAQNEAAKLFRMAGEPNLAFYHQSRAVALEPSSEKYQMNLAFDLYLAKRLEDSLALLLKVKEASSSNEARIDFFINKVKQEIENQT